MCARNTNSWPRSRYNALTKYSFIILISCLDSWVSKSSAPSLQTATAYVMSLRSVSYLILFSSISCYPTFRQCVSLIISSESSIMCVRLSAEGIQRLYEAAFNDATERSRAVTVVLTVCIALPREPVAYQ